MPVPKRQYGEEVQRYALAARMVTHQVRTVTIRRWTGLSEGRVRQLYRLYLRESGERGPRRLRGPAPTRAAYFLRNARARDEAGALAAVCLAVGSNAAQPIFTTRRSFPNVRAGEQICHAYEMFCTLVGSTDYSLEHALLLTCMLAEGTQLRLARCHFCGGAMVVIPHEVAGRVVCKGCRRGAAKTAVHRRQNRQSQTSNAEVDAIPGMSHDAPNLGPVP